MARGGADLGCRPPRISGRNRHHHQSASAVRPGTAWRARPRPRPLRALADQHVSRRVAGHGADRTGGLRRRDRWRELPRLHRPDLGADPAPRRHRHRRQPRGPQGRRHPAGPPGRRGPHSGTCHPTARTSIPSSSASRSSRPSFAPLAVAAPRRSGRSSASAWRTSALTNAATIFGTAGTRPPHGHEKRFSGSSPPAGRGVTRGRGLVSRRRGGQVPDTSHRDRPIPGQHDGVAILGCVGRGSPSRQAMPQWN